MSNGDAIEEVGTSGEYLVSPVSGQFQSVTVSVGEAWSSETYDAQEGIDTVDYGAKTFTNFASGSGASDDFLWDSTPGIRLIVATVFFQDNTQVTKEIKVNAEAPTGSFTIDSLPLQNVSNMAARQRLYRN